MYVQLQMHKLIGIVSKHKLIIDHISDIIVTIYSGEIFGSERFAHAHYKTTSRLSIFTACCSIYQVSPESAKSDKTILTVVFKTIYKN